MEWFFNSQQGVLGIDGKKKVDPKVSFQVLETRYQSNNFITLDSVCERVAARSATDRVYQFRITRVCRTPGASICQVLSCLV